MRPAVLVAGGGTGGHVVPALAVAAALAAPGDVDVAFVGTARGLESRLVPEAGFTLHTVEVLPLVRRPSPQLLRVPGALLRAVGRVTRLIRGRRVVAAVTFGGYVSAPLALAARRTRTPLVVHEQNAVPGLANRLAERMASAVAVTYASSAARFHHPRVEVTGNPVRPGLGADDPGPQRQAALAHFELDAGRRTLLVFGGSQGARRVNAAAVAALAAWPAAERLQVLHATGRAAHDEVRRAYEAARAALPPGASVPLVRCVDFVERMDLAYALADTVVCRSGASTIAELTVVGRSSVLVPYPHATGDHQAANAAELAAAGAAVVVADEDLDAVSLVSAAAPLLADDGRRERMGRAARAAGHPDAAARVAALVREVAGLPPAAPSSSLRPQPIAQPRSAAPPGPTDPPPTVPPSTPEKGPQP